MAIFIISCLVWIFVCYSSATLEDEPVCSKLKYDKEMLEIMVRMEARMKQSEKERKIFEEQILAVLEYRREVMQQSFSDQNEKLQKMFEDYQDIRDELSNRTMHLEELTESLVCTPKIAFNAYTKSSKSYSDDEKVIFPNILLNEGGGYNNVTGYFTAPTAGLYHFSAHVCHLDAKYMVVSIVHEGKEIATTTGFGNSGNSCTSVNAPVIMKVGENVFIKSSYPSNMVADGDYRWPSFEGFLVNK